MQTIRTLCLFHEILTTKAPSCLYDKIRLRTNVHNIKTRHRNCISSPPNKTSLFERLFSYTVYSKYNSLSNTPKSLSPDSFKKKAYVVSGGTVIHHKYLLYINRVVNTLICACLFILFLLVFCCNADFV